jgi:hypothetical protein
VPREGRRTELFDEHHSRRDDDDDDDDDDDIEAPE